MTNVYLCCRPPYPLIYSNTSVTKCCCQRCYEISPDYQKHLYPIEIPVIHTHSKNIGLNILHCVHCGIRLYELRYANSCTICRLNVLLQEISICLDQ